MFSHPTTTTTRSININTTTLPPAYISPLELQILNQTSPPPYSTVIKLSYHNPNCQHCIRLDYQQQVQLQQQRLEEATTTTRRSIWNFGSNSRNNRNGSRVVKKSPHSIWGKFIDVDDSIRSVWG